MKSKHPFGAFIRALRAEAKRLNIQGKFVVRERRGSQGYSLFHSLGNGRPCPVAYSRKKDGRTFAMTRLSDVHVEKALMNSYSWLCNVGHLKGGYKAVAKFIVVPVDEPEEELWWKGAQN